MVPESLSAKLATDGLTLCVLLSFDCHFAEILKVVDIKLFLLRHSRSTRINRQQAYQTGSNSSISPEPARVTH